MRGGETPLTMANTYNFTIKQGTTHSFEIAVKSSASGSAYDLTGCTVRGQIRRTASSSTLIASFTATFAADRTTGIVTLSLSDTVTSAIPVDSSGSVVRRLSKFTYDVELVKADGTIARLLEGTVSVSPEVTK